jgi:PAS domain S-box-containing protein/putative nucleotidyltransferase with HDIG domain
MMMGTTLYVEYLEKKELLVKIHNQGDAADRLIDQINVSYNNTRLIQEIGQAASMILDINRLLVFIMEALEKRLDFDRGMIMLANRERTHLIYTIGYGYNTEERDYLENIEFHLDNPDSRGAFVVSFRKQTPFLINDISEIAKDFSPRSIEFIKRMGTRSFICVPITYESRSEGVLAVDNQRSDRTLNETDISMLMGIASQIGICINTTRIYEKLQEREKRFRILAESAPDIIFTLDTEGMLTYVNPVWMKILGHKQEEVVGKYLTEFVQEHDSNHLIHLFRKIRDHKETQMDILLTLMSRSGAEHSFSFNCAPNIAEDGHVDSLVGIFKDVTDLRRSEVELKKSYEKLEIALSSTISVISLIVESRDPYTAGHQSRVANLASAIAREMGLPEDRVKMIHMAGLIHDIGKINVPAEILSRPGKLSAIEFSLIKIHPETGYSILSRVDFPAPIAQIVYQHHEKMDGSGYPLKISGDQIILESRIITVADVVEAMAGHRPYRPALGIEKALDEIRIGRGVVYDAEVADACISLFSTNRFHFEDAVTN